MCMSVFRLLDKGYLGTDREERLLENETTLACVEKSHSLAGGENGLVLV